MSQEYATFNLFEALSLAQNTSTDAVREIKDGANIELVYCIPKRFAKRRTDISAAEAEEEIGPDTGPAGQFVELRIMVDRKSAAQQDFLNTLLIWHGSINTALPFKRGFLGLENQDNPSLNLDPLANIGYQLSSFEPINPVGDKGTQEYIILIQLRGDVKNLPAIP